MSKDALILSSSTFGFSNKCQEISCGTNTEKRVVGINNRFYENNPSPHGGKISQVYWSMSGSFFTTPNGSSSFNRSNRDLIIHTIKSSFGTLANTILKKEHYFNEKVHASHGRIIEED